MQCVYTEFIPVATVVVDEVSDLLESMECDGMLKGGVWGGGVDFFPVVAIVADKVGDCAEDLERYVSVLEGHGLVHRRERPVYL